MDFKYNKGTTLYLNATASSTRIYSIVLRSCSILSENNFLQ